MVEIKNAEVFNLERAERAIKNSFNVGEINTTEGEVNEKLAKSLGGNMQPKQCHDSWLNGILVCYDIKGNGVFLPEFQRYHFQNFILSQSTMHSMEKFMNSDYNPFTKYVDSRIIEITKENYRSWSSAKIELDKFHKDNKVILDDLEYMSVYASKEKVLKDKVYETFETLVHNLPRGFELWATITSNYLQLKTQVIQRFHHKNKEDWGAFVEFCYSLPKFRELCGFESEEWDLKNW